MIDRIRYLQDGDEWEKWIDKCYRLRYQHEGYQKVPPNYLGDGGIEGYTKTGIVYQCYCPEKEYTDDELWEKQRDKVTKDIKKLIENGDKLCKLGIHDIKEWHFVIPEYRDKRILEHCEKKRKEVLDAKAKSSLDYINDKFQILIKEAEDFITEINKLVFLNSDKFDIKLKEFEGIDWNICSSEKLDNIKGKLKKVINPDDKPELTMQYEKLVHIMSEYYVRGIEIKNNIKTVNPELYEMIFTIDNTYKDELAIKCLLSSGEGVNKELFQNIMEELDKELKAAMGNVLKPDSISELKFNLLGAWLADCPIDFI